MTTFSSGPGLASTAGGVRLPHGVRDYLPEAAARRRAIAEGLVDEFERWGYRRIITPAFEYEAVLSRGLGPSARAQAVRFVEPGSGEVVMLRPDITPQVARLVATRLHDEPGPIRLSYEGAVVRLLPNAGGQREVFQAGIELVDAPSPAGEVEVIALAAAALTDAGVATYTLDLGEASVARAALAPITGQSDSDGGPTHPSLWQAIARKDTGEVGRIARALGLPARRCRLLEALPSLYGGPEVIERAAALLDATLDAKSEELASARAGLKVLATVVRRLQADGLGERIGLDLGEVRGFDYYTGVRFQGYAPGVGEALLSGGRYDRLIERYGRQAGAAGFAVDVERVSLALQAQELASPSVMRAERGLYLAGEAVARGRLGLALRRAGHRVIEELDEPMPSDAELVLRAARAGLTRILVLVAGGGKAGSAKRSDGARTLDGRGESVGSGRAPRVSSEMLESLVAGSLTLDGIFAPR